MDETMGNPQETAATNVVGLLTDYTRRTPALDGDLHWLGGILDGEGSFGLTIVTKLQCIKPVIQVSNTSYDMIEEIARICDDAGIPYLVCGPYAYRQHRDHKPQKRVQIAGIKRNVTALEVLIPYLRTKREVAKVVKAFCDYRLSVPKWQPYGEYELGLRDTVTNLNRRGRGKDIVGPVSKDTGDSEKIN